MIFRTRGPRTEHIHRLNFCETIGSGTRKITRLIHFPIPPASLMSPFIHTPILRVNHVISFKVSSSAPFSRVTKVVVPIIIGGFPFVLFDDAAHQRSVDTLPIYPHNDDSNENSLVEQCQSSDHQNLIIDNVVHDACESSTSQPNQDLNSDTVYEMSDESLSDTYFQISKAARDIQDLEMAPSFQQMDNESINSSERSGSINVIETFGRTPIVEILTTPDSADTSELIACELPALIGSHSKNQTNCLKGSNLTPWPLQNVDSEQIIESTSSTLNSAQIQLSSQLEDDKLSATISVSFVL